MLSDDDMLRIDMAFFSALIREEDDRCLSRTDIFLEILNEYGYDIVKRSDDNAED